MDIVTILGIALGLAAILVGQVLEGGTIHSIMQFTAALIVFGGTAGAVLINYPLHTLVLSMKNLKKVFFNPKDQPRELIRKIGEYATIARKEGLLALEPKIKEIDDPFFAKGLQLIVDGTEPQTTREILEVDVAYAEEYDLSSAKVFESAGGYAPTIGILGAVLGLIHVMENLAEPEKLGTGIAVAFVATVYGVGSANLLWLPIAGKMKQKIREESIVKEMLIEGLIGLSEGENPKRLEEKLEGFLKASEKEGNKAE